MSYSILSVYLLLSASVRHAPFRYRSNPTFRSPASLALSLSRPFFSFSASFFTSFFHSPSSPFFRLSFLSSLLFSRALLTYPPSYARSSRLPSSLLSLSSLSSLSLPPPSLSHAPPPAFGGPPPESGGGGAQGNLTIQGPTVGLAAFYFAAAFFGADFFTAVFFAVFGSVFSATVFPAALAVDFRAVFFLGSSVLFALRAWIMA